MLSKDAIKRGYNRGNYVRDDHTPPPFTPQIDGGKLTGSYFQVNPIQVSSWIIEELRTVSDQVITRFDELVIGIRDWWTGTMIAETGGIAAAPVAVIVKVSSTEQIQAVMRIAHRESIPVTVSAARSNCTGGSLPVRGGIVLDVCKLNKVISFDRESQIVDVESGMFGGEFEEHIQAKYGMTLGNWPSSWGVSTVGGWVACRGAGQLSTRYGKIEDMVFGMDVVLANGDLIQLGGYSRAAMGPELMHLFIGSEGTLGIITRIRFKLHRLPDYGNKLAYGFETFAQGLAACRELMQAGANPAVLRLYDKLESGIHFNHPETNLLLIADEGAIQAVDANMAISEYACQAFEGKKLDGEKVLEDWLEHRYLVGAPVAGFKPSPGLVADTIEMTGHWSVLAQIYDEMIAAINSVPGTMAASAHQSHAYIDGACIYFSMRADLELDKRAEWYRTVADKANAVLLHHKVAITHHHGVGLYRARYMKQVLGGGFEILRSIKSSIDPKNILNPGKLGLDSQ